MRSPDWPAGSTISSGYEAAGLPTSSHDINPGRSSWTCRGWPVASVVLTALEDRVDERRQRRTLGKYQQPAHHNQHKEDGEQPPFFADLHKGPQLSGQASLAHWYHPRIDVPCR